jgi:hypothetical protein
MEIYEDTHFYVETIEEISFDEKLEPCSIEIY